MARNNQNKSQLNPQNRSTVAPVTPEQLDPFAGSPSAFEGADSADVQPSGTQNANPLPGTAPVQAFDSGADEGELTGTGQAAQVLTAGLPAAPPSGAPASPADSLKEQRQQLVDELASIQQERQTLQSEEQSLSDGINALTMAIDAVEPPVPLSITIQEYIRKAGEIRAARVARQQALLDMGVKPSELTSHRSPLDRALSVRKSAVGRPQFPRFGQSR